MGQIYQVVKLITVYLLMVSVLMEVVPDGTLKRYVQMFAGLLLVLLMASEVVRLFSAELFSVGDILNHAQASDHFEERLWEAELAGAKIVQKEVETEIFEKAQELLRDSGVIITKVEAELAADAKPQMLSIYIKEKEGEIPISEETQKKLEKKIKEYFEAPQVQIIME